MFTENVTNENVNNTVENVDFNPFGDINLSEGDQVFIGISFIVSIVITMLVFFLFVKSSKKYVNKFVNWLKEFFNFRSILIENILKFSYLFLSIFITLSCFTLIRHNIMLFFVAIFVYNISLRLFFEFLLSIIMIWKNTSEISRATTKITDHIEK